MSRLLLPKYKAPAGGGGGTPTATRVGNNQNGWDNQSSPVTSISVSDPGANKLLIVTFNFVGGSSDPFNGITWSGASLTWTQIGATGALGSFTAGCGAWYATTGGSSPGAFTLTHNKTHANWGDDICFGAVWAIDGYNTSTPIGGKVFAGNLAGNGAISTVNLDAAPASNELTIVSTIADENSANRYSTPGTGTWTTLWSAGTPPTHGHSLAANTMYRSGSTSANIPFSDINSGNDNFNSSIVAVVIKG